VNDDDVARLLETIRRSLPNPEIRKLQDLYLSYLEVNELGLAFECLVEAADTQARLIGQSVRW
jgi:hypothetical protein